MGMLTKPGGLEVGCEGCRPSSTLGECHTRSFSMGPPADHILLCHLLLQPDPPPSSEQSVPHREFLSTFEPTTDSGLLP